MTCLETWNAPQSSNLSCTNFASMHLLLFGMQWKLSTEWKWAAHPDIPLLIRAQPWCSCACALNVQNSLTFTGGVEDPWRDSHRQRGLCVSPQCAHWFRILFIAQELHVWVERVVWCCVDLLFFPRLKLKGESLQPSCTADGGYKFIRVLLMKSKRDNYNRAHTEPWMLSFNNFKATLCSFVDLRIEQQRGGEPFFLL